MTCTRCYCVADVVLEIADVYGDHEADLCTDCIEDVGSIVVSIREEGVAEEGVAEEGVA